MRLQSFHHLFVILLSEINFLEEQVIDILPKLINKAHSTELREVLKTHLKETKTQLMRSEKIFNQVHEASKSVEWENSLKNIFENMEDFLRHNDKSPLIDAAIIAFVQKIEHMEIAIYGTLREFADVIDLPEVKKYLKESVKEAGRTDTVLTKLAKGSFFSKGINLEAAKH